MQLDAKPCEMHWRWQIPIGPTANRWLHAGASLALGAVLIACAATAPSPSGRGTHQRWGLPACLICQVSGRTRCPSCGLTTAFCHILRGQIAQAQNCNPAGLPIFGLWLAAVGYCAAIALVGKRWLAQELLVSAVVFLILLGCWIVALT